MQNSNIEKLVEDFENYLTNCKEKLFSPNEIIVSRDEVEFYINQIKSAIKPEIARVNKLMQNKDDIIKDARKRAEEIVARANVQVTEITSELQIMQNAYARANQIIETARMEEAEILENAKKTSREMQMGAVYYTDDLLREVQIRIKEAIEANSRSLEATNRNLKKIFETVNENRKELPIRDEPTASQSPESGKPEENRQVKEMSGGLEEPLSQDSNSGESTMKSVKVSLKSDSAEDIASLAKQVLE